MRNLMVVLAALGVCAIVIGIGYMVPVANAQANVKIYTEQGGAKRVYETGSTHQQDSGATHNMSGDVNVKSGGTLDVNSGGILTVESGGQLVHSAGSKDVLAFVTKSTTFTAAASESGTVFVVTAADVVATLPATAAGLHYTFCVSAVSTANGFHLSPQAADKIIGNGFTSADDKDAINTAATDREGDMIEVVGDGADGWYIVGVNGTWARE